ncbi:MAG: ferrochelatase [Coriobacteriaceae bacterium]|nr:ferrochelatase [Coriobacteriaceae bacterium]
MLMNTGTPEEPDAKAIKTYLKEFLSDPLLIRMPRPARWALLHFVILRRRPKADVERYQKIWEDGDFIFRRILKEQLQAVGEELGNRSFNDDDFSVTFAMRYGEPTVMKALQTLYYEGCDDILVLPLYPQSVTVCAGTCLGEVYSCLAELGQEGWQPNVVSIPYYYDQPAYIRGLAASIKGSWDSFPGGEHSKLVFSFHSTFTEDVEKDDPYVEQIEETRKMVADELGISAGDIEVVYQSPFGSEGWLGPDLKDEVVRWAEEGIDDLCVVCPGFSADCLETLVDVNEEMRDLFLENAAPDAKFTYVPALNAGKDNIDAICDALVAAYRESHQEEDTTAQYEELMPELKEMPSFSL